MFCDYQEILRFLQMMRANVVSKARWWCSRAPVRGCGLWRVYEHETVGQNFRLPELLGAVGLAAPNIAVPTTVPPNCAHWCRTYCPLGVRFSRGTKSTGHPGGLTHSTLSRALPSCPRAGAHC